MSPHLGSSKSTTTDDSGPINAKSRQQYSYQDNLDPAATSTANFLRNQLRAQQQLLDSLLDFLPVANAFAKDSEGNYLYKYRHSHSAAEELKGQDPEDLFSNNDTKSHSFSLMDDPANGGASFGTAGFSYHCIISKSKEEQEPAASDHHDTTIRLEQLRKELEETKRELEYSQTLHECIMKYMHSAYARHEMHLDQTTGNPSDFTFLEVNPVFEEVTGLKGNDILHRRMTTLFPGVENDPAGWIGTKGNALMTGQPVRFDNPSKTNPNLSYSGTAIKVPGRNEFITLFLPSKFAKAEEALQESEERHRNLFESMMQGVVYQEASGEIIAANPSAERILGLTMDQMCGRTSVDPRWKSIREDGSDFPGQEHPSMIALATGKPVINVTMGVFHPEDTTNRWIKIDAVPRFKNGDEKPYQVYTTFTDFTESKQVEHALLRAKEKAEEADKLKSTFLANVSHECRTPITGIIGNIDLVLATELAHEYREENLEGLLVARQSSNLLIAIIEDILDLSRIEAGQLVVQPEFFDLRTVMYQVGSLGRALISQKKKMISLDYQVDPEIGNSIKSDSFRLQQVLNNLVSNAIKFTDNGSVSVHVRIRNRDTLEVAVRDSGKGIPVSHLGSIFEPFSQVDFSDTRRHGGSGLGLTISKKLLALMGGTLRVESSMAADKHGSTFYVTLPYAPGGDADSGTHQHPTAHRGILTTPGNSNLILLVDDDTVSRKVVYRMLSRAGYDVIQAINGKEAVEKFESDEAIDLILMDIQMPIMDGNQAAKLIREIESNEENGRQGNAVPIIALSAGAMKGDRERGLAFGMTDYLTKPVNYSLLLETVQKHLACNLRASAA